MNENGTAATMDPPARENVPAAAPRPRRGAPPPKIDAAVGRVRNAAVSPAKRGPGRPRKTAVAARKTRGPIVFSSESIAVPRSIFVRLIGLADDLKLCTSEAIGDAHPRMVQMALRGCVDRLDEIVDSFPDYPR